MLATMPKLSREVAWRSEDGQSYLHHGDSLDFMASLPPHTQ